MVNSKEELSLTDLARRIGAAVPTILRDINRLNEGGYVTDRRVGQNRLVRINMEHPLYQSLWNIVMYGYGPKPVISRLVSAVDSVDEAYIFGSWASRYVGQPGPDPHDVDVLVIGKADPGQLYDLAREATDLLRREVNISTITRKRWNDNTDGFVQNVRSGSLVELTGEEK
jgi:DNA-binding transcriptional ArsR family regulator